MGTAQGPAPKLAKSSFYKSGAKYAASGLATLYGAGFLIVSIQHWKYGIVLFDFLKPRVFAAGFWFLLLAALPIVAVCRMYALFGLDSAGIKIGARPENAPYLNFGMGCYFYIVALGLAVPATPLFEDPAIVARDGSFLRYVASLVAFALLGIFLKRNVDKHPKGCAVLSAGVLVAGVITVALVGDRRYFFLGLWFYLVTFIFVYSMAAKPLRWRSIPWERWVFSTMVLITLFAYLYDNIRASLGGGSPAPVTVQFLRPTPFCQSESCEAMLVDETEHGFYFVKNREHEKAYFIPRDSVLTIFFSTKEIQRMKPSSSTPLPK